MGKVQRVRFVAERVIGIPTLPTIAAKLMELVDNPKVSAESLARLIQGDQALTAKILKLANSVYFGMQREVSTVPHAVVVIGFNAVKDMGLSVSVLDTFKNPSGNEYFELSRFWEHAISVGVGAQMLAKRFKPEYAAVSFVAGLLHDIGKVVVNQYMNDDFNEIMDRVHTDNMDLLEAEKTVLDTTHDRIGGWLADRWNLPFPIVEAIEFHHNPYLSANHQTLAALVKLADYLGRRTRIGVSGNKKAPLLSDEDTVFLEKEGIGANENSLQELSEEFLHSLDQAQTFISLLHGAAGD